MRYLPYFLFACLLTACVPDDDDGQPTDRPLPVLEIADQSVEEGSNGTTEVEVALSLSGLNLTNVTIGYRTENGTAVAGEDFILIEDGRIQFGPGIDRQTITVTLLADSFTEEDETFAIVLFDVTNAEVARGRATITIVNDDLGTGNPYNIPTEGYTTPESYPGLSLVWEDEFEGETLNEDDWTYEIGRGNNGWGNNELQYYRRENTILHDSHLIIEARREDYEDSQYTSSRLITLNKQQFRYGRIDIRAVLPEGQGIWPALWMLGSNIQQIGWPACGEIDIMELVGHQPGRVHGTVHYGASVAEHQFTGSSVALGGGEKFSEAFHVFSIVWSENNIKWLVDDEVYYELSSWEVGTAPWPFNNHFFFIFNVAVGGNWPGSPDATTIFPQRMIVDYVRVFQ